MSGHDTRPQRLLWEAVLLRAWKVSFRSEQIWKGECHVDSAGWFGTPECATVCRLAGLDPAAVFDRFRAEHKAFVAAGSPRGWLKTPRQSDDRRAA